MSNIKKNMLRDRAKKIAEVTDEMWSKVDQEYVELVEEFLDFSNHSPQTFKQYKSGLRQFGYWLHDSLNNKKIYNLTKRDILRYMAFLKNRGLSSSAQQFKKACVSSFMNYIENIVADEVEEFKTFRNLTRGLPAIPKNSVYEKVKITKDEYDQIMKDLESDENYLGMAWVAVAFNVGARRSEIVQFKSEIVDYEWSEDATFIYTHKIRLKGKGEDGKVEAYMMDEEALKYIKLWIEKRGFDHEYIFTTGNGDHARQMSVSWADHFCSTTLSDILGRRINPHLFKASCVTYLLESGKPLEAVSKYVAHHNDVSTTIQHYDLRDFEEEKNSIFSKKSK